MSEPERLGRHSFLVQVHRGGIATIENLRTRERVPVEELSTLGSLVDRWVEEAAAADRRRERASGETTRGGDENQRY